MEIPTSCAVLFSTSDPPTTRDVESCLRECGCRVHRATDGHEAARWLAEIKTNLPFIVLDIGVDGVPAIDEINAALPGLPMVVLSVDASAILDAIGVGAFDFIIKPMDYERLRSTVNRLLSTVPGPNPDLFSTAAKGVSLSSFEAGESALRIRKTVAKIALSDIPVLIQGETGSGKEVLARYIHEHSRRSARPFVKLNCAALPSGLVESELFGFERGAFTGAWQSRRGIFEAADSGSLLLDEVGDMQLGLQAKLLQVIQDQQFRRLGSSDAISIDIRIMAATHRDLSKSVLAGQFREDLFYRLNVMTVCVPPLRDRRDEILPLSMYFLAKYATAGLSLPPLPPALKAILLEHTWPGNVRELENVIRAYVVLRDPDLVIADLRTRMRQQRFAAIYADTNDGGGSDNNLNELGRLISATESEVIRAALASTQGNRKKAATLLNIDYKVFLYKMKRLAGQTAD